MALVGNYDVYFTVGQSVIGPSSSASYGSALGYWYGLLLDRIISLSIIFKQGTKNYAGRKTSHDLRLLSHNDGFLTG